MFLFKKKAKKKKFHEELLSELKLMFSDIGFVYRNFFHWTISRVIISIWGLILGVILALPILFVSVIVGLIDPVDWMTLIQYAVTGSDPTHEMLIATLAKYVYYVAFMAILVFFMVVIFLLGSSYNMLLVANLSLHYIKRKKLDYKKNLYFSKQHIFSMMALLTWNTLYILAPTFIFFALLLGGFKLVYMGVFSLEIFSYVSFFALVLFILFMSYVVYKILFGYIVLAKEKAPKIKESHSYLSKSISKTTLRNYFKFAFIMILFFALWAPFQSYEDSMGAKSQELKDALAYKAGFLEVINPGEERYWEFITKEYESVNAESIINALDSIAIQKVIYFFITYLLFNGLFILIATSFYRHAILKK